MARGSRISGLFATSTDTLPRRTARPPARTAIAHEPALGNRREAVARPFEEGASVARRVVAPRASSVERVRGLIDTVARHGVPTVAARGTDTALTVGGLETVGAASRAASASTASIWASSLCGGFAGMYGDFASLCQALRSLR